MSKINIKPVRRNKIIINNPLLDERDPVMIKRVENKKMTLRIELLKFFERNPDMKLTMRGLRSEITKQSGVEMGRGSRQFERTLKELADDHIIKRGKCECHTTNMYSYNNHVITDSEGDYVTTNRTEISLMKAMRKYGELTIPFCTEKLKIPKRTAGGALNRLFKMGVFSSMYETRIKNSRGCVYHVYYPSNYGTPRNV
mgnify:FL=1|tara:strand:+ start:4734 stop:5330 length:597 start_codon:yes stop_codon:yes gene_type:complete